MIKQLVFFWKSATGFLFNKKKLVFLIFSGLFLNILGWLALNFFFPFEQETVILHYNAFLGIDQVEFNFSTNQAQIFFPLIGAGLIWLIDLFLGFFLYSFEKSHGLNKGNSSEKFKTSQLGAYLLWAAGDLVQLFVLVYVLAIILINS